MRFRRDWSSLNSDLLLEIADRVPFIEDVMAIKGVCSSWRVAMSNNNFKPRLTLPLLMLPGKFPFKKNESEEREFYSLYKKKIIMRLSLPEIKIKRCIGVGFGWILTVAASGDAKLFNPFTRAQVHLPNLKLPPCSGPHYLDEFGFISRALLCADPSCTSDYVLLASFSPPLGLGFWRTGNESWTKMEPFTRVVPFADITYYKGKFYAIDKMATEIWVWDPFESRPNPTIGSRPNPSMLIVGDEMSSSGSVISMVESSGGELLILIHDRDDINERVVRIKRFDIRRPPRRAWIPITGLGNDAIFVGENASTSLLALSHLDFIKPNHIYFSKLMTSKGNGKNMGIYNVADKSWEWLDIGNRPNRICSALWIVPFF